MQPTSFATTPSPTQHTYTHTHTPRVQDVGHHDDSHHGAQEPDVRHLFADLDRQQREMRGEGVPPRTLRGEPHHPCHACRRSSRLLPHPFLQVVAEQLHAVVAGSLRHGCGPAQQRRQQQHLCLTRPLHTEESRRLRTADACLGRLQVRPQAVPRRFPAAHRGYGRRGGRSRRRPRHRRRRLSDARGPAPADHTAARHRRRRGKACGARSEGAGGAAHYADSRGASGLLRQRRGRYVSAGRQEGHCHHLPHHPLLRRLPPAAACTFRCVPLPHLVRLPGRDPGDDEYRRDAAAAPRPAPPLLAQRGRCKEGAPRLHHLVGEQGVKVEEEKEEIRKTAFAFGNACAYRIHTQIPMHTILSYKKGYALFFFFPLSTSLLLLLLALVFFFFNLI